MSRSKALFLLVLTAVLWSIGGLFIKLIELNPIAIAGYRSGIAALVMLIYLRRLPRAQDRYKCLGIASYMLLVFCFVYATKMTTAANAILLQFTSPIWVAILSMIWLKEKVTKVDVLSIVTVLVGLSLFFVGKFESGHLIGDLIALVSGVALALLIVFMKKGSAGSGVDITALGNVAVFIVAMPSYTANLPTLNDWFYLLILGVFQIGISYILFTKAVSHVSALEAILVPVIEPLLNPVWVLLFTGERMSINAFIGGIIIIASVMLRSVYNNRVKRV